jgi:hypothetical protein
MESVFLNTKQELISSHLSEDNKTKQNNVINATFMLVVNDYGAVN